MGIFGSVPNPTGASISSNKNGGGETDFAPNGSFTAGETMMLVMQLDRSNAELNAWANPVLGTATGPTSADFSSLNNSVTLADFDTRGPLRLRGFRSGDATPLEYGVDEVRISDNFRDVAPIPEPGTYALGAGVLTLGLALLRRRRS